MYNKNSYLSCMHVGLQKWVEVGNSGVFRPEMLLPMGLPENVSVIAWGLSLERLLLCYSCTCLLLLLTESTNYRTVCSWISDLLPCQLVKFDGN